MLIPTKEMQEYEKYGFKRCKEPYNECYYLCVAKGVQMIFLSPAMITIMPWEETDPRIHSRPNCRYRDGRTALEILCELIQKEMVICDYQKRRHTIPEWEIITGISIIDPDGFDRKDPKLYERLFTREEFDKGLFRSTIIGK